MRLTLDAVFKGESLSPMDTFNSLFLPHICVCVIDISYHVHIYYDYCLLSIIVS